MGKKTGGHYCRLVQSLFRKTSPSLSLVPFLILDFFVHLSKRQERGLRMSRNLDFSNTP
jgi:hypothetical protein